MWIKRGICLLAALLLLCGAALGEEGYDFKTYRWGDSEATVRANEGEPVAEGQSNGLSDHYIVYSTTVAGLEAGLAYYFCDDGLYQIAYILTEEHSNADRYIDDYDTLRSALTGKYGEPSIDTVLWNDDSMKEYYQSNGKSMGQALEFGYCLYGAMYNMDRTTVLLSMNADNYEIKTSLNYRSNVISPGEADYSNEI